MNKNKMFDSKVLIVSDDYPISFNQMRMANLVIVIWNKRITVDCGTVYDDDIIPVDPYFVIRKNRWGGYDPNIHIPLDLLPKVLKDPSGNLDWISEN
jgi:hypothetical protein